MYSYISIMVREVTSPGKSFFAGMTLKKTARNLSLRRRSGIGYNLTANDQVRLRNAKLLLYFMIVWDHLKPTEDNRDYLRICLVWYLSLLYAPVIHLEHIRYETKNIDSFGDTCKQNFRFEADDIRTMLENLKFPAFPCFNNKIKMSGEEVFLRGLYELRSGNIKASSSTS